MGVLARELLVGKSAALPGRCSSSLTHFHSWGLLNWKSHVQREQGCPYWEENPALRAPQYKDVKVEWDM